MRTNASMTYQKTVIECALDLAGQGGFTAREFSEKCGFRLTPNLRRRLNQLVESGLLQATQAYNDKNRLATFFHKPAGLQNGDMFADLNF